ncbi:NAD(P)H-flavin reductase [Vibrio sp.]|uniref:NAD(P)H-flavin reductase n=1 Tax=Vibrio viridaestus TaxID=2487322 RepID=A0A3N9TBZ4_9VIBR|nr:NAD(P)H-flavin reductase [Vibrio viridaestus]MDC0612626.1 NAD(P)H-flavin reductase [Vibrio sp.]RQW61671.1 NAD(P)H-flavin reductase [Vibrio viridaestus]
MTIKCKVKSITPLACNTYKVLLQPSQSIPFKAGQYLMVVMGEKDKRPFSIASSPFRLEGELELHIGAAEHNAYAIEVVDLMKKSLAEGEEIEIDAPHGNASFKEDSDRSILLVAGGTGFSYVRSILDHCVEQKVNRPVHLYWGAKTADQLYAKEELELLVQNYSNISFVPVIEQAENNWTGKLGNVLEAIEEDFATLENFDIYIAGRFEMAGAARERFTQHKSARSECMFADAYAFI